MRKAWFRLMAGPIGGIAAAAAVAQPAWPTHPVRVIAPFRRRPARWGAVIREANVKVE